MVNEIFHKTHSKTFFFLKDKFHLENILTIRYIYSYFIQEKGTFRIYPFYVNGASGILFTN